MSIPNSHEFDLPFEFGGSPRRVTIWRPTGFVSDGAALRVVFCADGGSWPAFALAVLPGMQRGDVPPAVLVGVHNSPEKRAEEYLAGLEPARFEAHAEFFCQTVVGRIRAELGTSAEPRDNAVFGVSNGGAFAVAMGLRHPEIFGQVIAFSVARSPAAPEVPASKTRPLPRCYLAAGNDASEKMFRRHTAAFAKVLKRHGADCVWQLREGGHDIGFWRREFPLALAWAFGSE